MKTAKFFFFLLLLASGQQLFAQSTFDPTNGSEAFPELYHARVPSPRSEAMGRAGVCLEGDEFATWYNPAAVSTVDGIDLNFGYSTPYDNFDNARYLYFGLAAKLNNVIALGFNTNRFTFGEYFNYVDSNAVPIDSLIPKDARYTFTLGLEPVKDLHIGVNINYDHLHPFYTPVTIQERVDGLSFDLGVNYDYEMKSPGMVQDLDVAASLTNCTFSELRYAQTPLYHKPPIIFRIGGAYMFSKLNKRGKRYPNVIDLTGTIEFQDVLAYEYRSAFRTGAEVKFYEIVALRAGFYAESINPTLSFSSDTWNSRLTYGIGLECPISKLTGGTTPLDLNVDFSYLPQVGTSKNTTLDRFLSLGVGINYYWW